MEQIRLGNIYSEEFGSGFAGNVWDSNGISPTLTTGQGGSRTPLLLEAGHLEKGTGKHQSNIVFDPNGLCPTICAGMGVKQQPTMHLEVIAIDDDYKSRDERVYDKTYPTLRAENNFIKVAEICAMRGRDKTNISYIGYANENFEQTLEINKEGVCNTITTVQKDNLVLELDKPAETEKSLRAEQSRAEQLNLCKTSDKGRDDTNENRRCCGSELSVKRNTKRSSNRERRSMSDSNDGECPQRTRKLDMGNKRRKIHNPYPKTYTKRVLEINEFLRRGFRKGRTCL